MLQSFIGTFDSAGLRSLRTEEAATHRQTTADSASIRFWAILDSDELPSIHGALRLGRRDQALELLTQRAKSLGRLVR